MSESGGSDDRVNEPLADQDQRIADPDPAQCSQAPDGMPPPRIVPADLTTGELPKLGTAQFAPHDAIRL